MTKKFHNRPQGLASASFRGNSPARLLSQVKIARVLFRESPLLFRVSTLGLFTDKRIVRFITLRRTLAGRTLQPGKRFATAHIVWRLQARRRQWYPAVVYTLSGRRRDSRKSILQPGALRRLCGYSCWNFYPQRLTNNVCEKINRLTRCRRREHRDGSPCALSKKGSAGDPPFFNKTGFAQ